MSESNCVFVCALQCEANPLISDYKLRRIEAPYPVYQNDNIHLIISGVGKIKTAAATGYILSYLNGSAIFLNIGIAGHASLPIGTSLLAHKVTDDSSENNFYPTLLFTPPCQTMELVTVDKPNFEYRQNSAYDMESFGFYTAATKSSTSELIHCYKVISDNQESSSYKLDKSFVESLIRNKLLEIDQIKKTLIDLLPEKNRDFEHVLKLCHFTQTQRHQLNRLCQRWNACNPEKTLIDDSLLVYDKATELLDHIENKINKTPLRF